MFILEHLKYCFMRNTGENAEASMTQLCLLWATSEPDAVRWWDTSEGELEGIAAFLKTIKKKRSQRKSVMLPLQGVPYFYVLSTQLVSFNRGTLASASPCHMVVTDPYLSFASLLNSVNFFRIRYHDANLIWRMPYSYWRLKENSTLWIFRGTFSRP